MPRPMARIGNRAGQMREHEVREVVIRPARQVHTIAGHDGVERPRDAEEVEAAVPRVRPLLVAVHGGHAAFEYVGELQRYTVAL